MGKLIGRLLINIFALFVVSYLVPGFTFTEPSAIVVASVVIGVINTFIRPILQLIALPITLVTFGIFALVINVFLLMLASWIVPGFEIDGLITAFIASILLSLVSWFLSRLTKDSE